MSDSPDVLGFSLYYRKNGQRVWGCRGIGPQYDAFYTWLNSRINVIPVHEDWPWDYFSFENPADDAYMVEKYASLTAHNDETWD